MIDNELQTLLRDHVAGTEIPFSLRPEESVVRARVARLRKRRRRLAAGIVAAVAVAAVGAPTIVARRADGGRAPVGAEPTAPATVTPSTSGKDDLPRHRALAVTAEEVPALFASLYPGTVSETSPLRIRALGVEFLWNGFATSVRWMPASTGGLRNRETGRMERGRWQDAGPPLERCQTGTTTPARCHVDTTGAAWRTSLVRVDDTALRFVDLYTLDGWDIRLTSANRKDPTEPVLSSDPPFTAEQLLRAARSEVWFR
ncbi:hypothetical protein E8D34_18890 [Nocardioides sp. GY 10113]|uniref:hypothetical protein n=1 Tax=Nocardioides sp. GY 10113 TaxID=2569761 RepID=UPI0010A82D15|nr:hypothetical protein [Nocardioides sp. GY 10113]TIC80453.1 hypothetical protein E8D34_18890 [Nocardioides sp. GY 10113]